MRGRAVTVVQMSAQVIGTPAVHARALRREERRKATLALGGGLMAAGLALLALQATHSLAVAAIPAAASVVAFLALSGVQTRMGRLSAGIGAEDLVARKLAKAPVAFVVHNATFGAGDIDHVVVGPALVAIETKYGRGEMGAKSGKLTVGGKLLPRDALSQARSNAQRVSKALGTPCTPVVVVSQGTGPVLRIDGVLVCSADQLVSVLDSCPSVVAPIAAASLAARLTPADAR